MSSTYRRSRVAGGDAHAGTLSAISLPGRVQAQEVLLSSFQTLGL